MKVERKFEFDDSWRKVREAPPPCMTICEGYWPAWVVGLNNRHPARTGLCVKGAGDHWHNSTAIENGISGGNMLVFNPTHWRPAQ